MNEASSVPAYVASEAEGKQDCWALREECAAPTVCGEVQATWQGSLVEELQRDWATWRSRRDSVCR